MARILKQRLSNLSHIQNKLVLPERFKGTVVEKWALYWKNLYIDYRSMVSDLVGDIQEKPIKAMYVTGSLIAIWKLAESNPDFKDFKDDLKRYSNELLLVSENNRNQSTVQHFKYVEQCFNESKIRKMNLGVASLLWVDDYADDCDIYKARCEYTKPGYLSVLANTVDIGFMGKWWNLYRKYHNFDVNDNNFVNSNQ